MITDGTRPWEGRVTKVRHEEGCVEHELQGCAAGSCTSSLGAEAATVSDSIRRL
jgi:hypothetical protein